MLIGNRNLFRLSRLVLLKFPAIFRFFAKFRKPQKRLLIIKTDAIGDYILFRNFLEIVKGSDAYKDYEVDMLGNVLWQDLALNYDRSYIERSIFIKANKLYEAPLKTFKLAWRLFRRNYELVLQPSSTRTFINDGLAGLTAAKQIIGFESDNEGIPQRYKVKTDRFYTELLQLPPDVYFEFERTKFFFESVLKTRLNIRPPSLPVGERVKSGIIIFPGAGNLKRGWNKENLLSLIKRVKQHTNATISLVGSEAELNIAAYLEANLPTGSVNNLIGKSTLPQLITLIADSALLIANETSAIHIAAATKTKSVCILGGGHFGRFAPYPAYFENAPVCLYHQMECYNCNWGCKFKTEETEPFPCIDQVSLDRVWGAVLPLLPQ